MEYIIQLLDWDTDFFRRKTGRVFVDRSVDLQSITALGQKHHFDMIYLISKEKLAVKFEPFLMDCKRSYTINSLKSVEDCSEVREFKGKAEKLYDLSYQAGWESRFKKDPGIPDEDFKRLYSIWIDNSINKGLADYVLSCIEQEKAVGLITAKKE